SANLPRQPYQFCLPGIIVWPSYTFGPRYTVAELGGRLERPVQRIPARLRASIPQVGQPGDARHHRIQFAIAIELAPLPWRRIVAPLREVPRRLLNDVERLGAEPFFAPCQAREATSEHIRWGPEPPPHPRPKDLVEQPPGLRLRQFNEARVH